MSTSSIPAKLQFGNTVLHSFDLDREVSTVVLPPREKPPAQFQILGVALCEVAPHNRLHRGVGFQRRRVDANVPQHPVERFLVRGLVHNTPRPCGDMIRTSNPTQSAEIRANTDPNPPSAGPQPSPNERYLVCTRGSRSPLRDASTFVPIARTSMLVSPARRSPLPGL